ncbi:arsenate reductase [Planomicrobium stackebrandtii]|uniref:Arsenate reductase n=1 Tax=Planomicrobium stackebrandtii TaxID=253160 RepID=A0ABU0GY73_9BACL|nr:arsenate reductase family protein [Planomicrobium stackebrandtii]MDQ0430325.1 arsenate reductase [Planomicrobium stackebrandtii]
MITYYAYPKCTTCRKAKSWLEQNNVEYNEVHIAESPPTKEQLTEIYQASGLELKKFFNTSGLVYRSLSLKDKLSNMTEQQQLELLASDGMLIKRPLAWDGKRVTLGFKEAEYQNTWL